MLSQPRQNLVEFEGGEGILVHQSDLGPLTFLEDSVIIMMMSTPGMQRILGRLAPGDCLAIPRLIIASSY